MKKKILGFIMALALVLPFTVHAEEAKVNMYLFRGQGCSHCAEFIDWWCEVDQSVKDKVNFVTYETWYNEENATLMQAVAAKLGTEASGVPFIVIGDQYFSGFASSMESEILATINTQYEEGKSYDALEGLDASAAETSGITCPEPAKDEQASTKQVVVLLGIALVVAVVGYAAYKMTATKEEAPVAEPVKEEPVVEVKKTVTKKATTSKKKATSTKKTTTKKKSK